MYLLHTSGAIAEHRLVSHGRSAWGKEQSLTQSRNAGEGREGKGREEDKDKEFVIRPNTRLVKGAD